MSLIVVMREIDGQQAAETSLMITISCHCTLVSRFLSGLLESFSSLFFLSSIVFRDKRLVITPRYISVSLLCLVFLYWTDVTPSSFVSSLD